MKDNYTSDQIGAHILQMILRCYDSPEAILKAFRGTCTRCAKQIHSPKTLTDKETEQYALAWAKVILDGLNRISSEGLGRRISEEILNQSRHEGIDLDDLKIQKYFSEVTDETIKNLSKYLYKEFKKAQREHRKKQTRR